MYTIKDVAKLAETSTATVSRVINGKPVRQENKDKVVAAMRELSFNVNNQARSLKTNRTMVVGVVIPRLDHIFFMRIAKEIQVNLSKNGYFMLLADSDSDFEREQQEVRRMVNQNVDGLILVPSTNSCAYLAEYADSLPIVLLDQLADDFEADTVVSDSVNCVYSAVELFLKHGHKRIGIICGPDYYFTSKDRLKGYLRVHEDYMLELDPELIKNVDYTIDGGESAMESFLAMEKDKRPTAIMATNYDITKGVVIALQKHGCKIPDDFSVIGYDFDELATIFSPSISIVVESMDEIGRRVVDLLLKNCRGQRQGKSAEVFRIKPTLLVKESIKDL